MIKMIIDLTRNIHKGMASIPFEEAIDIEWSEFPGFPDVNISSFKAFSHIGTHIDSPYHFIPNGKKIHEIDVNRFVGKGYLIDLSDKKRELIVLDDMPKTAIEKGHIIIINTGMEKYWPKPREQHTELSEEAAKHLLQYEPKMIGADSLAIDYVNNNFKAHKAILDADVPIIEELVDLDKLIGKTFDVMAFPLKIDGLEASPARVLAKLH
jgi:kynurenine formamidase